MILLTLSRGKGEETVRLQLPASPAEIGETFAFLDRISLDITATINHGSYIPEALHVERIDDMALYDGDFEAAKAAEQDGVRLIYGMDGIPDGIYIDTPENRELIRKGLGLYPDYRNWRDDFDPSFVAELDVMQ